MQKIVLILIIFTSAAVSAERSAPLPKWLKNAEALKNASALEWIKAKESDKLATSGGWLLVKHPELIQKYGVPGMTAPGYAQLVKLIAQTNVMCIEESIRMSGYENIETLKFIPASKLSDICYGDRE